jgi:uncharacterized protein with PIN domain
MDAPRETSKKPSGTKAERLLRESTFFVDRSLGRRLGIALREAGWNVELHDDHFKDDTPDEKWLEEVGKKGWVVLTKDKAIRKKADHAGVWGGWFQWRKPAKEAETNRLCSQLSW